MRQITSSYGVVVIDGIPAPVCDISFTIDNDMEQLYDINGNQPTTVKRQKDIYGEISMNTDLLCKTDNYHCSAMYVFPSRDNLDNRILFKNVIFSTPHVGTTRSVEFVASAVER